jgi:hypothetical protein
MALLTSDLISESYYLSSIISRDFETPTGSQTSDGLSLLNDVLADRTIDHGTIPYTDKLTMPAVQGQSVYFIDNLIDLEVFVFYINSLRFQTLNQQRKEFFGSFRATDINSLPFNWHVERKLNGANLYLYFVPDTNYPLELWGQFRLSSVTLMQDLSLTIDRFYTNFLKYLLAERLCQFNSYRVPPDVATQLEKYYEWINNNTNVLDLRTEKFSSLSGSGAINYGIVNLSGGWMPTGFR